MPIIHGKESQVRLFCNGCFARVRILYENDMDGVNQQEYDVLIISKRTRCSSPKEPDHLENCTKKGTHSTASCELQLFNMLHFLCTYHFPTRTHKEEGLSLGHKKGKPTSISTRHPCIAEQPHTNPFPSPAGTTEKEQSVVSTTKPIPTPKLLITQT